MAKGKYHEWITPAGLLKIQNWFRSGLTDENVAKNMGISLSTFYEYQNRFPDISEAVKEGKRPVDTEVENALLKSALGYEYTETKTVIDKDSNGKQYQKIEKMTRYAPPNPTSMIFWLKNRRPKEWRDKREVEMQADVRHHDPFADLSRDELLKIAGLDDE